DGQVVAVRAQEVHVYDVILLNEVLHSQGVGNRHRIVDVDRDLSGRGRLLVGKCGGAGPGRPATYRRRAGPEGIEPDSRGENRTIEQKAVDDPIGDTDRGLGGLVPANRGAQLRNAAVGHSVQPQVVVERVVVHDDAAADHPGAVLIRGPGKTGARHELVLRRARLAPADQPQHAGGAVQGLHALPKRHRGVLVAHSIIYGEPRLDAPCVVHI